MDLLAESHCRPLSCHRAFAAEKLEALRARQPHYLEPSFDPIVAYGSHGAIVHYSATEESDIPLEPQGFLLSDTGGHYLEGTTDVTRTIALGPVSADMKRHYTLGAAQPPAPAPRSVPVRLPRAVPWT